MSQSDGATPGTGSGFVTEVRRRKVVRAALAYLAVAWLLLQVVDVVGPVVELPDSTARPILLLLAAGFPVVVLVAWFFELTPDGVKTTQRAREQFGEAQQEAEIQRRRNLLAYATGATGAALLIGVSFTAGMLWTKWGSSIDPVKPPDVSRAVPTIAVLPFENMSPAPENAFFADGVHEEILTQLSRLPDVDVICRISVKQISEDLPSLPEVARRLRATHIVEGSVRRAGDTVRITVQLIDASTEKHLWAETYDRELRDVFAIQTDVAMQIAGALESTFSPQVSSELAEYGTESLEAYDLFLKARQLGLNYNEQGLRERQIEYLHQALEVDPDYAAAWQLLVRAEVWLPHIGVDPEGSHLRAAEYAFEQARRLSPKSVDTMLAEAWLLYQGKKQFRAALDRVRSARVIEPRRSDLIQLESFISRRLGDVDGAQNLMERASVLDPLNVDRAIILGNNSLWYGRYRDSLRAYLRAYRATTEPGPWFRYRLEVAKIFVAPSYDAWRQLQDAHLEELRGSGNGLREKGLQSNSLIALFIEHLYLTGRSQEVWPFYGRDGGRVDPGASEAIHSAYWETAALAFIGEQEQARQLAERTLAASLETHGNSDTNTPRERYTLALHKAWLGAFLGKDDLAAEGLTTLKERIRGAKDALSRQLAVFFYIEGLLASDPRRAQEIYLEESPLPLMQPHDFATRPHFFYRLLDSAEVRDQFHDQPAWVQFMRDSWPESRKFPFD